MKAPEKTQSDEAFEAWFASVLRPAVEKAIQAAVAAEREACAHVCDSSAWVAQARPSINKEYDRGRTIEAMWLAEQIRARANKETTK